LSEAAEIGKVGEKAVVDNLKSQGYEIIEWNTQAPGATDIEAAKPQQQHILIQVKTAVYPNVPADLSQTETDAVKSRAARKNAVAYAAKVQLRADYQTTVKRPDIKYITLPEMTAFASVECPKCKQRYTPRGSFVCPHCGYKAEAYDGVAVNPIVGSSAALTGVEATTYELTDKEFDSILRDELKRYLQEKLGPMKITMVDKTRDIDAVKLKVSKLIAEPEFASVATDYVSLRSQEQQAKLNLKLQRLILLVAIGTLFIGVLSLIALYI
jgi:Holliday junction resolvase-like predicted endonuclease